MLSIIVPVYNGEKTISYCLKSLCSQTYTKYEIIVVDDGSTDNTLEVVKKFADINPKIRIISRENKGYGYSLNEGIMEAKGDWIANCDADDKWASNFAELMMEHASADIDIVKCGWFDVRDKVNLFDRPFMKAGEYDFKRLNIYDKFLIFAHQPSIWSAIYRKDFLLENDIWFLNAPGASFQDTSFTFKIWLYCTKAYFVEERLCYYTVDNDMSSVKSKDKVFDICNEYKEIERVCPKEYKPLMARMRFGTYMWNYNRLDDKGKELFFPMMRADFRKDLQYVQSKYFTPIEWAEYSNIVEGLI